jgi:oligopeptide transport system substrate-binding protein
MKIRIFAVFIVLSLLLGAAQPGAASAPSPRGADAVPTLRLPLDPSFATLDPALVINVTDVFVANQLFAGLTRIEDASGATVLDLAESCDFNPAATQLDCTLRSGLTWSDGTTPLTAEDVRYGILRSLNPDTGAGMAYVLYPIVNAEAYNTGSATEGEVGITTSDARHISFQFNDTAVYFLSVLAIAAARPMPQAVIEANGSDWTQPAHILTSGPYNLTEWVPGDHLTLEKNGNYWDAAGVQIEKVLLRLVDNNTAWSLYLGGDLDTANVLPSYLTRIQSDPLLQAEYHVAPLACTYYYGFNTSPQFRGKTNALSNPLVRKALIAAADRQGLIDTVMRGGQRKALTFTPPGIFGAVESGVGIDYDPAQARTWMEAAGYPQNGAGVSVTLSFNASTNGGNEAVADFLHQSWLDVFPAMKVIVESVPWPEYSGKINNGTFQAWRMAWCYDYNDALNFLKDGVTIFYNGFGAWDHAAYDVLLQQAATTADPDARKALYRDAEEVLVETDAVMLPLFFNSNPVVAKTYLTRPFGLGSDYLPDWTIARSHEQNITTPAAEFQFAPSTNTYIFPPSAFAEAVTVKNTTLPPADLAPSGARFVHIFNAFEVAAFKLSDPGVKVDPLLPYQVKVAYSPVELQGLGYLDENTLALYYWDDVENKWVKEPTSAVDTLNNFVTAAPDHFSTWVVMGGRSIHLPLMVR